MKAFFLIRTCQRVLAQSEISPARNYPSQGFPFDTTLPETTHLGRQTLIPGTRNDSSRYMADYLSREIVPALANPRRESRRSRKTSIHTPHGVSETALPPFVRWGMCRKFRGTAHRDIRRLRLRSHGLAHVREGMWVPSTWFARASRCGVASALAPVIAFCFGHTTLTRGYG